MVTVKTKYQNKCPFPILAKNVTTRFKASLFEKCQEEVQVIGDSDNLPAGIPNGRVTGTYLHNPREASLPVTFAA